MGFLDHTRAEEPFQRKTNKQDLRKTVRERVKEKRLIGMADDSLVSVLCKWSSEVRDTTDVRANEVSREGKGGYCDFHTTSVRAERQHEQSQRDLNE